jgi:diguanylate cyclase (GGDEF)-like protein/PAS domain S-box-containing protein
MRSSDIDIEAVPEIISAIMELSSDQLILTDDNGIILSLSKQLLDRLGFSIEKELIGTAITKVLRAYENEHQINSFVDYLEKENLNYSAISRNTGPFSVDVTVKKIRNESSTQSKWLFLLNDFTKDKGLLAFEEKSVLVLNALQEITGAIYSKLDLNELFKEVLEQISRVISFDSASIFLLEGDSFYLVAEKGFMSPQNVIGTKYPIKEADQSVSPNYLAIESRKSIRSGDVEKEYPQFVHPLNITIRSWMTIPLLTKEGGIGTLNLDSFDLNNFTEEDQWIAEIFTAQVANAIENALAYKNVEDDAKIDPLTGLLNRRYLYNFAEHELPKFHPERYPISLIVFDIDKFKSINDTLGHLVGDQILKTVSEYCSSLLRRNDILGRYGGDEFVIVMPNVNIQEAAQAARRLCTNIANREFQTTKEGIHISASFGVATVREGDTITTAFDRADKALFMAKENGRNQVAVQPLAGQVS